jgi:putative restriction endonuclease
VRISKEISGNAVRRDEPLRQGRGEFEWCDVGTNDPDSDALIQRRILLALTENVVIDTSCVFGHQGGKQRVRTTGGQRETYPNWQIATALMMPRQTRTEQHWGDGLPILRTSQYCVTHINFGQVTLEKKSRAKCIVETITIANQFQQVTIKVADRFADVQTVWAARQRFDEPLARLIAQHENLVQAGSALGPEAHRIVDQLQEAAARHATDYGIPGTAPTADVLPSLLRIAQKSMEPRPSSPVDQIPAEEIHIRRRCVKDWRLWAASRGAASARFRREVREAYCSTCLVCGLCLPTLGDDSNPGVDAAYILPWVQVDLDHIKNGICLCKFHHWAFDDGLIEITYNGAEYIVRIPNDAEDEMLDKPEFSRAFVKQNTGVIPKERLPADPAQWPSAELLAHLRSFIA